METIFDFIMNRFYEQNILEEQFPSIVKQLEEQEESTSEDFDNRTFLNTKQPVLQEETSSELLSKEERSTQEQASNGLLSKEKQEEVPSELLSKEERSTQEQASNGLLSKEKQEEVPSELLSKEERSTQEQTSGLLSKEKQEEVPSELLSKEEGSTQEQTSNGLLSKEKQEEIPNELLSKEKQTTKETKSGLLSKTQEVDGEVVYDKIQSKKESSEMIQQKKYNQEKNQSKDAPFIEQKREEQKQSPLLAKDGSIHLMENEMKIGEIGAENQNNQKKFSISQKENKRDVMKQNQKSSFVLQKDENKKNVSEIVRESSVPTIQRKGKKLESNVLEEMVSEDRDLSPEIIKTQQQNQAPISKEDTKIKSILQSEETQTNVLNELDSSNPILSKNNSMIEKNEISELLLTEKKLSQNLFSLDMEEEKQNQKKVVSKKNLTNQQKEQIINELTNSNKTFDQYTNVFENATQNHTEYNPLVSENLGSDVILNKIYEVLANQSTQRTNNTENVSVHVSQLDAGSGMESMMSEISRQLWQTRQGSTKNCW